MNNPYPDNWQMVRLRDIGQVDRGRSRHRPRYAEHLYGGPYPFIQTGDVKSSNGRIMTYSQTYSEAGLAQSRLWPTGTMCITIAANIAETAILTFPACFPDSVIGFIADETKCDVYFIEYMFRYLKNQIQFEATGSVQDNINLATIDRLYFPLPPLPEQHAIAHILGSLDDKIEANRRMNATLEATARALFQSWFVDFDPVYAKVRGEQPSGMDTETAALFPDRFDDSELGPIPAGWRVVSIGDVSYVKHGYAFEGQYFSSEPSDCVLLTPGNFAIGGGFKSDKFKYYSGPTPKGFILEEDDLLVTMTDLSKAGDTLGYPALIPKPEKYQFLHNQRLGKVVIKPESWVSKLFLYYLMRTESYRLEILGSATGSTVKHTSPGRIQAFSFMLPSSQITRRFDEIIVSLYSSIKINEQNTVTLAETRDVLLPKLVSGELRVGEI